MSRELAAMNPVRGAEEDHRRPSKSAVSRFAGAASGAWRDAHGATRGGLEADAACGQLTGAFTRKQKLSSETRGGEHPAISSWRVDRLEK